MTPRPGDLLALPVLGDDPSDAIALRYAMLLIAVACAALALRGRRVLLVVAAAVFMEAALLFWTAGLGRPYGIFVDPAITRAASEVAAARLPGEDGPLSGEPRARPLAARLASLGVPADAVIASPTILPLLVVPAIAFAVLLLWPRHESAEAATLWLAFSTAEATAIHGGGFLPGVWSHPLGLATLLVVVVVVLASARLPWPRLRVALAAAGVLALVLVRPSSDVPPFADRLLALTVDQLPWLLLGGYGLASGAAPGAWALACGGGALYLAGAAEPWTTHAACRLGLILAATAPLLKLAHRAAVALVPGSVQARLGGPPGRVGFAALLLFTMPGSFTARWNPFALDAVAAESRPPLSTNVRPALAWVRANVPEHATCLASPDYAALVAIDGQRRVLRAPGLWEPADDQRRRRVERTLLAGREPDLLRRYQVGCVFFAASDVGWLGADSLDALDGVEGLQRGYADAYVRVYAVSDARSWR